MMEVPSNAYFGVSITRASMLARLLPNNGEVGAAATSQDWQEFIDKYTPLFFGICRKNNLQTVDAEDITQETLVKIITKFQKGEFVYDPKRRFRSWLATIVRHAAIDSLRKQKRLRSNAAVPLDAVPEEDLAREMSGELLREELLAEALKQIESEVAADQWAVFRRVKLNEEDVAVVAASTGKTQPNIYVICGRIHRKIEDRLRQLVREDELHEDGLASQ